MMTRRTQLHRVGCVLLLIGFLLAGCGKPAPVAVTPEAIAGLWKLKSAVGYTPKTLKITKLKVTYQLNGTWQFTALMGGMYTGTRVEGGGKWQLKDGVIYYTDGKKKTTSKPSLTETTLTLSPDPLLMPDGKTPVTATYEKVIR